MVNEYIRASCSEAVPLAKALILCELPGGFQRTASAMRDAPSMTLMATAKTFNRLPFPEFPSFTSLSIWGHREHSALSVEQGRTSLLFAGSAGCAGPVLL
jgi:hypothetical protein